MEPHDRTAAQKMLLRAAELVEFGWCRHVSALGAPQIQKVTVSVSATDPQAVQWCVTGALTRAAKEQGYRYYMRESDYVVRLLAELEFGVHVEEHDRHYLSYKAVQEWNDYQCHTGDEAAALLRRAAARVGNALADGPDR